MPKSERMVRRSAAPPGCAPAEGAGRRRSSRKRDGHRRLPSPSRSPRTPGPRPRGRAPASTLRRPVGHPSPIAFARDTATHAYYERRAAEYDEWYAGTGVFAERDRPGWHAEVERLVELVRGLPPARTLDVACGTGFLTRHLRGLAVGLDQSAAMVAIAQQRLPGGLALAGDALALPFADGAFDRVLTAHFYGHLVPDERAAFLAEARRVASELVVIDTARRAGRPAEDWEQRVLNDGSRHRVFKRYLDAGELAAELGGGEVLLAGSWFVAVAARLS
jgi:ubiquinone/menaquinone biosynthesis C-methylase UbiE